MRPTRGIILLACAACTVARVLAANLDDVGDPVRNAQRMKDCMALHAESANHEGLTQREIAAACIKAINEGDFKDATISLDGMIKAPQPVM